MPQRDRLPVVSIIIPCYNEERTIRGVLESLYHQSYPRHLLEVVIADGRSTDKSRDVIQAFAQRHPDLRIKLVDNPKRIIPVALNIAISHATGEYIVRVDGHCSISSNYVEHLIRLHLEGKGTNVGGVLKNRPRENSWIAHITARIYGHPLAVGDAWYRQENSKSRYVDHVSFGTFHRDVFVKLGGFNEALPTNEDYEMNIRIRRAGGKIWLDPSVHIEYYPPATLLGLWKQFFRYGYGKLPTIWKYPSSLRWRQLLPPVYVFGVVTIGILAFFSKWAFYGWLGMVVPYLATLIGAGLYDALRYKKLYYLWGIPMGIGIVHWAWGIGFLVRLVEALFRGVPPSQIPRFSSVGASEEQKMSPSTV